MLSFAALSRWQRISLVRDLANAKVQDGDSTVSARYARERKHSALELLEKARHKARNVFDRQVCPLALTNSVESRAVLLVCDRWACLQMYCPPSPVPDKDPGIVQALHPRPFTHF